jgi:hypothetical protein
MPARKLSDHLNPKGRPTGDKTAKGSFFASMHIKNVLYKKTARYIPPE